MMQSFDVLSPSNEQKPDSISLDNEHQENSDNVEDAISLSDFIDDFGEGLLANIEEAHPPRHQTSCEKRTEVMQSLKRVPFEAQNQTVQAICTLLLDEGAPAGILNGEMGTGKTIMGIAATAVAYSEKKAKRFLMLSPCTWFTNGNGRFLIPFIMREFGCLTVLTRLIRY